MTVKGTQKTLHTFSIDYKSDLDDKRYIGDFTCRKLTIADLSALGVRKAQLNGGMHYDVDNPGRGVDFDTDFLNNMLAHLEIVLVKTPAWWKLNEIADFGLVAAVHSEVDSFEASFRNRQRAGSDNGSGRGSEGNSEGTVQEADEASTARSLVDREVQAALEP